MNVTRIIIVLFTVVSNSLQNLSAQGYDSDRVALSHFIERMYRAEPFEGCRIVDDYERSYFLTVVVLEKGKYKNSIVLNRVAQVKSQRTAGEFFNGSQSYSEMVIRTPKSEEKGCSNISETIEVIKTNSIGYVQQLQLLTSFDMENTFRVFIFFKVVTNS